MGRSPFLGNQSSPVLLGNQSPFFGSESSYKLTPQVPLLGVVDEDAEFLLPTAAIDLSFDRAGSRNTICEWAGLTKPSRAKDAPTRLADAAGSGKDEEVKLSTEYQDKEVELSKDHQKEVADEKNGKAKSEAAPTAGALEASTPGPVVSTSVEKWQRRLEMEEQCVPMWCLVMQGDDGGLMAIPQHDDWTLPASNEELFAHPPPTPFGSYVPDWWGSQDVVPTTLVLDKLPRILSQVDLLGILDNEGFAGLYDFVFVPTKLSTGWNEGYAVVNLRTHEFALALAAALHGRSSWGYWGEEALHGTSTKACRIKWSRPLQGLDANVRIHRNHPANRDDVPEGMRPQLFSCGWPVPFPKPSLTTPAAVAAAAVRANGAPYSFS